MTRTALSVLICILCVGMGLETARMQSDNYARAAVLDNTKRKCDLLEAGAENLRYGIDSRLAELSFKELHIARETFTTVEQ
ncbi:MAG: hypothetical protein ACI9F9_002386 [Candidatus Paceibacteria bacterium]|jgi:hypothetical protein